jgi:hypothetical protein
MENNKRLKEIKLAIYLNYIDKIKDRKEYSKLMRLLTCIASTLGEEYLNSFSKIIALSINDGFIEASNKELVLTCKKFLSKNRAAHLLGLSRSTFYYKYNDLLDRDYEIKDMQPKLDTDTDIMLIDFMTNFIERFKFKLGNEEHDLKEDYRTLEIEFWLIYDKLINIFRNVGLCDTFIFNLCNAYDIDYTTIAQLKNNIHIITRMYPSFMYNNRYFMQEVVTLYTHKGLTKGAIGSSVLGKDASYLYNGNNRKYTTIPEDDMWQYTRTIEWKGLDKEAVLKFIDVFHSFIRYDV